MSLFQQKLEELINYCDNNKNVETVIQELIETNNLESGLITLKLLLNAEKQKLKNRRQYLKNKLKQNIKKLEQSPPNITYTLIDNV